MSYLTIESFIEAGRKSLKDKNYWSALSVALMLPSMCSRIAFKNDKETYCTFKGKGEDKKYTGWSDKKCYVDFCKIVFQADAGQYDLFLTELLGEDFANALYRLRCDIIHAGVANLYDDGKGVYFILGDNVVAVVDARMCKIISINDLCKSIFEHIDQWCCRNSANNFKYTYMFDVENNDDMLLYNRLRNEYKADRLEQKFINNNKMIDN